MPQPNRYLLTDPSMVAVSKKYLSWVREVRAALARGAHVQTSWQTIHTSPESFRAELWEAIERRINERGGGLPTGRKWCLDYEAAARRDARRIAEIRLRRVRHYQFETAAARRRYGHLLSDPHEL